MKLFGFETAPGATEATPSYAEVDRLLGVMRTAMRNEPAQPAGIETRVLSAVRAHATRQSAAQRSMQRVWSPVAVTASLLCLFTGGFLVARDTAQNTDTQQRRQSATLAMAAQARHAPAAMAMPILAPPGAGVENTSSTLSTASARLKPAAPIPAGRRRGRAGTTAASSSK